MRPAFPADRSAAAASSSAPASGLSGYRPEASADASATAEATSAAASAPTSSAAPGAAFTAAPTASSTTARPAAAPSAPSGPSSASPQAYRPTPAAQPAPSTRPTPATDAAASATAPTSTSAPATASEPRSAAASAPSAAPAGAPSEEPSSPQRPSWPSTSTARGFSGATDSLESDDPEERGRSRARQAAMAMTGSAQDDDSVLLKGATSLPRSPESRTETHWAGVLIAVVLFPLAWFLVHDGAATLTGGNSSAWPAAASPVGALEILGGTAACATALFMISRSSLGAFVVGAVSAVIGLPFVLMPGVVQSVIGPTVDRLQAHSDLGLALSTYVMDDGLSGRFILMGVLTAMVAVVAHLARRAGRSERETDDRDRRD
ncbi:hypothetical protein [Actinomyces viscosus]|uniref:hypothetical protein n=1 Tax=Actinomyces viscosus TaxID=1656 RepID=UPI001E5CDCDA|nr:hypothetical protein [Actinomyces viscosus]